VPVKDASKLRHLAFAVRVTVYAVSPDSLLCKSKNTLSEEVGTVSPPAPPELAAQCVVVLESQSPVPPTQYLSAIYLFYFIKPLCNSNKDKSTLSLLLTNTLSSGNMKL